MKPLPIGISDFREVVENGYYYIDKSLFIRELLDSGSKSVLITRPRRFGKTLNLSMLRYFYERTETDTSDLFDRLAIWRQGEAYREKQGKHPVIFLTFKDVKCGSWDKCYEQLIRVLRDEFLRHENALLTGTLKPIEAKEYRELVGLTASEVAYESSLKYLSQWLSRHYGKNTVILIDEYDTPVQDGYLHGYYDQVIGFMRNLLSGALKDNSALEKGVLTGILRVAKESVFSGLNNLRVCSLLQPAYSRHFGLLDSEVEQLLGDYGVEQPPGEVKDWYNGYVFGGEKIYNPWSILSYADAWRAGLQPYWINTSGNDLVRQLLTEGGGEVKEELEGLLRGEPARKALDEHISFRDIRQRADAVWSFLLFSGYLKLTSYELIEGIHYGELLIPNKEVEVLYRQIVLGWFEASLTGPEQRLMLEALVGGETDTFEALFREFVTHTFSLFDTGGEEPEKVYHAFVLGLLVSLRERYEVKSNRESGYGRYDVMLIPKETSRKGVIIEFKKARRGETLEQAAAAALRQIEDKRYESELLERGIRKTVKLGIAFAGKQLRIESRESVD